MFDASSVAAGCIISQGGSKEAACGTRRGAGPNCLPVSWFGGGGRAPCGQYPHPHDLGSGRKYRVHVCQYSKPVDPRGVDPLQKITCDRE